MSTKNHTVCVTCGHKSIEYKYGFSKGLADLLAKLGHHIGPVVLSTLDLKYGQRTNAHKLRYWDLATQTKNGGEWEITQKGRDFLAGRITIPRYAFTVDNVVTKFEAPDMNFDQARDGWKDRAHFQAQASEQLQAA